MFDLLALAESWLVAEGVHAFHSVAPGSGWWLADSRAGGLHSTPSLKSERIGTRARTVWKPDHQNWKRNEQVF